ncbi:MAG: hypothetical protein K2G25_00445 [Oscillospiraceae bacterium]|nr:hypothetical protein [Oscillospiraceae bacterium]
MSKKNQKKNSCKQKSRKGKYWIGEEYIIQYRSGERSVLLAVCSFVCVCNIALTVLFIVDKGFLGILLLLPAVPAVLSMLYTLHFRIQFRMYQKKMKIQKLFQKSQAIPLDEIQEIYYSTDGKVKFLNIITESTKIHVNTSACENVDWLKIFLEEHCEHKFRTGIRKELHLL